MVIAVFVGLMYGTTLLFGILPISEGVSWDGHFAGALAGVIVAFCFAQKLLTKEVFGLREQLAQAKKLPTGHE